MQKSKKQRQQKELKQSLKTFLQLTPHLFSPYKSSQLSRIYPQIAPINSLRIFAVMEVLYLLELTINLLQKRNANVGDLRIGIIGGGITARLILNSILPLSKDGLDLRNITVSTRQTDNFNIYAEHFGVKVVFDNETSARQADFLIVCTPATLDNWIISDLKVPIKSRVSGKEEKPAGKTIVNNLSKVTEKLANSGPSALSADNQKSHLQMSGSIEMHHSERFMKPIVYILTSDFTQQKCDRFFEIPVLVPSVRSKNLKEVSEKLETIQGNSMEAHEKVLAWWLTKSDNIQRKIQSREGGNVLQSYGEGQLQTAINKYYGAPFLKILIAFNHAFGSPLSISSLGSSLSITISVNQSTHGKKKQETMLQILQAATASGDVQETFLKKCKKWKMAYSNFTA